MIVFRGESSKISWVMLIALAWFTTPSKASAVEIAPRISDREIIESLAELKTGQKNLSNRLDGLDKRMDALRTELKRDNRELRAELKKDIQDLRTELKQDINNLQTRMDFKFSIMIQLFIATMAMIGGLIGFIVWDRRTAVQPVKNQMERVQLEWDGFRRMLERDLDLQNQAGSHMTRLIHVLRERAGADHELARILRSHAML